MYKIPRAFLGSSMAEKVLGDDTVKFGDYRKKVFQRLDDIVLQLKNNHEEIITLECRGRKELLGYAWREFSEPDLLRVVIYDTTPNLLNERRLHFYLYGIEEDTSESRLLYTETVVSTSLPENSYSELEIGVMSPIDMSCSSSLAPLGMILSS